LSCYVNRCNEVVVNILQQLSALYTQPGIQNGRSIRLMDVSDLHLAVCIFLRNPIGINSISS
ncbi:unnamed protein product, partial [Rotaria magnacalcarata]